MMTTKKLYRKLLRLSIRYGNNFEYSATSLELPAMYELIHEQKIGYGGYGTPYIMNVTIR